MIKHATDDKNNSSVEGNVSIFGGFTKDMWNDDGKPSGDIDSYIFRLIPKYNVYKLKNQDPESSEAGPCYLNSRNKRSPKGLGTKYYNMLFICERVWDWKSK